MVLLTWVLSPLIMSCFVAGKSGHMVSLIHCIGTRGGKLKLRGRQRDKLNLERTAAPWPLANL